MSTTEQIKHIIAAYVGCDTVRPEQTLDELGLDSLSFVEMSIDLEDVFGKKAYFSLQDVGELHTVQDIITIINSR